MKTICEVVKDKHVALYFACLFLFSIFFCFVFLLISFIFQIQYYLNVLKGQATLPTREEMFEDSRLKDANRSAHVLGMRQFDYEDDLAWIGRFEPLPAYFKNGYSAWKSSKVGNLLNYKNSRCVVASDNIKVEIITQSGQGTQILIYIYI